MSSEELKKRRLEASDVINVDGSEVDTPKKVKVQEVLEDDKPRSVSKLKLNSRLQDSELVKLLQNKWGKSSYESTANPKIKLASNPFFHGEFSEILADSSILHKLQDTLEYEEKSSDLFHFHQSCDLNSLSSGAESFQPVQAIKDFFQGDLFNFIQSITSLPLNGKFDIFASQYEFNDHLLCHDDELDSRRIAFIIYMTEDWKPEFGGTLDLFDSVEAGEDNAQPGSIVMSLCPEFNKLVFFEVTAKSFHQVSEVIKKDGDCRRAISGWFYGDPLPRPQVQLPQESFENVNFMERSEIPLDEYLDKLYLNSENVKVVNEKLSENSEILLSNFFKDSLYPSILKELELIDSSKWNPVGPANLQSYETIDDGIPQVLLTFFKSKTFLEFLQELTEFSFASEPDLRFTASLKKFQHGSYTLVRGKDRGYKIKNLALTAAGVDRLNRKLSDSELSVAGSDSVGDVEVLNGNGNLGLVSKNGSGKTLPTAVTNGQMEPRNFKEGSGSKGEVDSDKDNSVEEIQSQEADPEAVIDPEAEPDSGSEDEVIWEAEGDSEEEEETEEPNRVDVMFFVVPPGNSQEDTKSESNEPSEKNGKSSSWDEKWGGCRIYTDDLTGNALINLTPADNSLAIVVRDESISSHYSYVNCLAQNRIFYSYDFEFNFPRSSTAT